MDQLAQFDRKLDLAKLIRDRALLLIEEATNPAFKSIVGECGHATMDGGRLCIDTDGRTRAYISGKVRNIDATEESITIHSKNGTIKLTEV